MNTDRANPAAEKSAQQPAKQKRRGWFRRNWKWFLPLFLLAIVVVGGGAGYWYLFLRVYKLDVVQRAMQAIADDKGMQEALGRPIESIKRPASLFSKDGWQEIMPSARVEENEIDVRWNIQGTKAQGKAHTFAKRRQGKWETLTLEVTPAGGKRVSIREAGDDENEAVPFVPGGNPEPPKSQGKKPEAKSPDINIDLPIPPGDTPPEKK
jgi:hypothetical protein